jgi:hypothetical protein
MEAIKDPPLFAALRTEALQAFYIEPSTGRRVIDAQKLVALPLLQSVYTETMRLHISYVVTRKVLQPLDVDEYQISPGSLLQASTQIAHHEEAVWAVDNHSASEFWAERHVRYVEKGDEADNISLQAQFSIRGRPSAFFPYGTPKYQRNLLYSKRRYAPGWDTN